MHPEHKPIKCFFFTIPFFPPLLLSLVFFLHLHPLSFLSLSLFILLLPVHLHPFSDYNHHTHTFSSREDKIILLLFIKHVVLIFIHRKKNTDVEGNSFIINFHQLLLSDLLSPSHRLHCNTFLSSLHPSSSGFASSCLSSHIPLSSPPSSILRDTSDRLTFTLNFSDTQIFFNEKIQSMSEHETLSYTSIVRLLD